MPDIDVFESHFHSEGPEGAATTRKWLDSGEVTGILCCTSLRSRNEDFEARNADLLKLSQELGRDRLPLLAMIHLNQPGWREQAAGWFDRWPTLVGIKLHPPCSKYRLSPELLDPVFDFALERGLCIASHTTPVPGWSAIDFHESLLRRPETRFVIYHGSTHEQSAYLAEAFANVYVEPSWLGFFPSLFQLTRRLGSWRKILAGTDGPGWFASFQGSPYDDLVALARKHLGDEEAVRDFCGNNVRTFLGALRCK